MVKRTPDPNLRQITFGVFLVVVSVVVLFVALDLIELGEIFTPDTIDFFIAFGILALGMIYIFGFLNPGTEHD